ncbi:MAG: tetratricopeptide repeat protein [Phormidesmis sp.]
MTKRFFKRQLFKRVYGWLSCLRLSRTFLRAIAKRRQTQSIVKSSKKTTYRISRGEHHRWSVPPQSTTSQSTASQSTASQSAAFQSAAFQSAAFQTGYPTLSRAEMVNSLNQALQYEYQPPKDPLPPLTNARMIAANQSLGYRAAYQRDQLDHPDVIRMLADSAYLCERQRRYSEAERLYKQVLTLQTRRYGKGHAETIDSLSDLAALYAGQKRYSEAEPLLRQMLTIQQQSIVCPLDLGNTCGFVA